VDGTDATQFASDHLVEQKLNELQQSRSSCRFDHYLAHNFRVDNSWQASTIKDSHCKPTAKQ